jgi:hypothetical protein
LEKHYQPKEITPRVSMKRAGKREELLLITLYDIHSINVP